MSATTILIIILAYFAVLMFISFATSKGANNDTFFTGNKKSPWYLVAFGMIGASLSGVTFISVTGQPAGSGAFGYMQMVFGYLIGYQIVAFVLMPIYYKWNLTSIYTYLQKRFGEITYKTGAVFFLVSRTFGASVRLLLVAQILDKFVFSEYGFPFWASVVISVLFIWLYTFRGGIKTIVWTDTLQTLFMLSAAGLTFIAIANYFDFSVFELTSEVFKSDNSKIFFTEDVNSAGWFGKMFLAGMFIAIAMTGLDQDMMQKNLSCKTLKDAQKNMVSFSVVLIFVNLFFLMLGGALLLYAQKSGVALELDKDGNIIKDAFFPTIALQSDLGIGVASLFVLGLVAAAYSSADSALTSLTTSVCVDFLDIEKKEKEEQQKTRIKVHVIMSVALIVIALILNELLAKDALMKVFFLGGLTYGPLLGLFFYGIFTKRQINDKLSPVICIISAVITFFVATYSKDIFNGFAFGGEIIILNGGLTYLGLHLFSRKATEKELLEQEAVN